jgi:hypothetical protein
VKNWNPCLDVVILLKLNVVILVKTVRVFLKRFPVGCQDRANFSTLTARKKDSGGVKI